MTFVFLEQDDQPVCMATPQRIIRADVPGDVPQALAALEAALDDGFYAAGFFAYELGYCLDQKLLPRLPAGRKLPLLWFAISKDLQAAPVLSGHYTAGAITPTWDRATYTKNCTTVIDNIHAGEIYQANLTFRARFPFTGNPRGMYADLRARQPNKYGGMIETDEFAILSASPELFVHIEDNKILTRPMKGTAPRGLWHEDDETQKANLAKDPKQRAENLMIVDLMRNDVSRIATNVRVDDMFAVQTHRTLHQMTSDVSATSRPGTTLPDILKALFAPGSVTGAPKIRAMEIISDLEPDPRGVYCGAFGLLGPDNFMRLNVAIRTITIQNGMAEIGIGSGVVADSQPDSEYDECLLKMRFLTPTPEFSLIETMRRENGVYAYWAEHEARLKSSCARFGFPYPDLTAALAQQPDGLVRLLVHADGTFTVTSKPLTPVTLYRFILSDKRLSSTDPYLFHKTTMRDLYDGEFAKLTNADEVVFLNERGEVCEGSRTTLFLDKGDGILLTPALACGLLPGTLRAHLLATGRAREAVLTPADMAAAAALYLGNSVRGLVPAKVVS